MSSTVRKHSAVLVRVLSALNGYHAKHGGWPSSLALDSGGLAALVVTHLTPEGLYRLQTKVELLQGMDGDVVASGRDGQTFSYGNELNNEAPQLAHLWLGLELEGEDLDGE